MSRLRRYAPALDRTINPKVATRLRAEEVKGVSRLRRFAPALDRQKSKATAPAFDKTTDMVKRKNNG